MNAFHLLGLIGAVVVAAIGWNVAGLLGIVLGVPAGILVGVFGWIGTFLALGWLGTRRDQLALRSSFGPYWQAEYRTGWEELKVSLRPGTVVNGVVVRVRYHGAFLDLGEGFPGLVQAYHLVLEGSELPSLGENVRAWVKEYDDDLRAVVLTMNERSSQDTVISDPRMPNKRLLQSRANVRLARFACGHHVSRAGRRATRPRGDPVRVTGNGP